MKIQPASVSPDDHGRRWLICYDVADDGQRAAISRVLSAYGDRVQYSVFTCWLTVRERRRLLRELSALRCLRDGSADLRVYPLWASAPGATPLWAPVRTC